MKCNCAERDLGHGAKIATSVMECRSLPPASGLGQKAECRVEAKGAFAKLPSSRENSSGLELLSHPGLELISDGTKMPMRGRIL